MIYNQWILTQSKDTQSKTKSQNIFKRKRTVTVSERENATIVTLRVTMQMNVESQRDCNRLLKQRKDWSNKSRS